MAMIEPIDTINLPETATPSDADSPLTPPVEEKFLVADRLQAVSERLVTEEFDLDSLLALEDDYVPLGGYKPKGRVKHTQTSGKPDKQKKEERKNSTSSDKQKEENRKNSISSVATLSAASASTKSVKN